MRIILCSSINKQCYLKDSTTNISLDFFWGRDHLNVFESVRKLLII